MKKISILILLFILSCICSFIWFTTKDFTIPDSKAALEKELNIFISESDSSEFKVEEIKNIQSSNTWIALLSSNIDSNENILYAHLEKNWRNHYKIISVGSVPNISYIDIKTNIGLFGVLVGINNSLSIKNIDVKTLGEVQLKSTFDVEGEKYFIKYISIEKGITNTSPATFTLYDKNNQVIQND